MEVRGTRYERYDLLGTSFSTFSFMAFRLFVSYRIEFRLFPRFSKFEVRTRKGLILSLL